jgi:hypothetical protein
MHAGRNASDRLRAYGFLATKTCDQLLDQAAADKIRNYREPGWGGAVRPAVGRGGQMAGEEDKRGRLAARIRELFDQDVGSGVVPNSAAVAAFERASREEQLQATCALLFPRVEREVVSALVCSAPDARLTHALATQLADLSSDTAPSPGAAASPQLLALQPPPLRSPRDSASAARAADVTGSSSVLRIFARRATVVVSASDAWEVESAEPVHATPGDAASASVQVLASNAFRVMQIGSLRLRVAFRRVRMSDIASSERWDAARAGADSSSLEKEDVTSVVTNVVGESEWGIDGGG